jgi:hypothetical protein
MKPLIICLSSLLAGGAITGVYTGGKGPDSDSDALPVSTELQAVRASISSLDDSVMGSRADFEQLDGRLDALEESIVVLSTRGTETEAGPTLEEVLAAVGELRTQVEQQFAETRTSIVDASRGLRRQKEKTDWAVIAKFLKLWESDEEAALRDLRRLSDDALLERFGPPSEVWHRDKGLTWVYTQGYDAETDAFEQRLFLNLVGRYVAGAYVEKP